MPFRSLAARLLTVPQKTPPLPGSAWRITQGEGQTQTRVVLSLLGGPVQDVEYRVIETGREGFMTVDQWHKWCKRAVAVDITDSAPDADVQQVLREELQRLRNAISNALVCCERHHPSSVVTNVLRRALAPSPTDA